MDLTMTCFNNNGNDCCSIIWILLLLSCCGGCGNGGFLSNGNGCGSGFGGNSCIWIILLLLVCGGGCGETQNNSNCGCC